MTGATSNAINNPKNIIGTHEYNWGAHVAVSNAFQLWKQPINISLLQSCLSPFCSLEIVVCLFEFPNIFLDFLSNSL